MIDRASTRVEELSTRDSGSDEQDVACSFVIDELADIGASLAGGSFEVDLNDSASTEFSARAETQRVRCVVRSGKEADTIVALLATTMAEDALSAALDTDALETGSPFAFAGGTISSICPTEQQSSSDPPEHCEAFWTDASNTLLIGLSFSVPAGSGGTSAADVVGQLQHALPALIDLLAT